MTRNANLTGRYPQQGYARDDKKGPVSDVYSLNEKTREQRKNNTATIFAGDGRVDNCLVNVKLQGTMERPTGAQLKATHIDPAFQH